jgi:hypothetical protein
MYTTNAANILRAKEKTQMIQNCLNYKIGLPKRYIQLNIQTAKASTKTKAPNQSTMDACNEWKQTCR